MKHTRKIALCLCRLLLITGFVWMAAFPSVRAADSIVLENGTELQYTVSNGQVTITGIGADAVSVVIPAEIDGAPVAAIGSRAFYGCTTLTEVEIPASVSSVGNDAFRSCTALKTVVFNENKTEGFKRTLGSYAFGGCTALTEVTLSETSTSLGNDLFNGCTSLAALEIPEGVYHLSYALLRDTAVEQITIPASVTSVNAYYSGGGNGPFAGCTTLKEVTFAEGTTRILHDFCAMGDSESNIEKVTIPESVTRIDYRAFQNCRRLTSIDLPESLTLIESEAFSGCTTLTEVEIPASVSSVGNDAFRGCTALKTVVFNENKTEGFKRTLGSYAFGGCTALTEVTLSETSTSLGNDLFNGCTSLAALELPEGVFHLDYSLIRNTAIERITVPASVTSVNAYYSGGGNGPFAGCTTLKEVTFAEGTTHILHDFCAMGDSESNLEKVVIPEGVTRIDSRAFHNCRHLQSIDLPESLTLIESEAFAGCTGLTEVEIPASVSSVGNDAFRGCTSLEKVVFGENTSEGFKRTLGSYAFGGCTALTDVTLSSTSTSLGNDLFNGCTSLAELELPEGVYHLDYSLIRNTAVTQITVPASVTSVNAYYSGGGNGPFAGCTTLKEVTFAEGTTRILHDFCAMGDSESNLEKVTIPESVTRIDSRAFHNCRHLQSIDLPESLTLIESEAFAGCTALTEVEIPASVSSVGNDAFRNCTALKTVVLNENKTEGFKRTLGGYAFGGCTSLTDVKLSETSTSLGNDLFNGCTSLAALELPEGVYHLDYSLIRNTAIERITVPASVTSVNAYYSGGGNGPFAGCTTLKEVTFAEGTTRILHDFCAMGDSESNIEKVTIPEGVTRIDSRAFHNCRHLQSIDLPESLTLIDSEAFAGCTGLTEVEIPASVSSVGNDAFRNCTALKTVVLNENKTEGFKRTLGSYAFGGCTSLTDVKLSETSTSLGNDLFNGCTSLAELELPEGVYHLGQSLIRNTAVTQITVPASVTSCNGYYSGGGNGPFAGCTTLKEVIFAEGTTRILHDFCAMSDSESSLEKVVIPEGVTRIDSRAFHNCRKLQSIVLPRSLTLIESEAFAGCTNLEKVYIYAGASSIHGSTFQSCGKLTIYCEADSYAERYAQDSGIPSLDIISDREELTAAEAKFYYQVKEHRRGYCAFHTDIDFILVTEPGDGAVLTVAYTDGNGPAEQQLNMTYDDHLGAYIASMDIIEGMVSIDSVQAQVTQGEAVYSHRLENSYWYSMPLLVEGTVTVRLSENVRDYTGMKLKLYEENGRLAGSCTLGDAQEIVFHGLKPGSTLSAVVMAGEMEFARQDEITVTAGRTTVLDLTGLPRTADLRVRFVSGGREVSTQGIQAVFYDMTEGKSRLFSAGRELYDLAAGDTIGFSVRMDRDTALHYMLKTEPQPVTLSAGENVVTVELTAIEEFTYTGKLTDEKTGLPVFNALVKVNQMANGTYSIQSSVRTDRNGSFSLRLKDLDGTLIVSKSAYSTLTLPVERGNYPQALELTMSGGKIKMSLGYMPAYPENLGMGDVVYEGRPDSIRVYNVTQDKLLAQYQNTYPVLYTDAENMAEGDVIRAELQRKGYRDLVLEGTADVYGNVELGGTMYEMGAIQVSFRREDHSAAGVQALLFDETGALYKRCSGLKDQDQIGELAEGTYTLALVEPLLPLGRISSLSGLQSTYRPHEDYALISDITVSDGMAVCPAYVEVPCKNGWTSVLGRNSRLSGDTSAMIGDTIWLTAAVTVEDPQMLTDETLHITLPQGVRLTDVSASAGGTRVQAVEIEGGILVPLETTRAFSVAEPCLVHVQLGAKVLSTVQVSQLTFSAELEYTRYNTPYAENIGQLDVSIEEVTLAVPSQTNSPVVYARGIAPRSALVQIYANDVLLAETMSSRYGAYRVELALDTEFKYSRHNLTAVCGDAVSQVSTLQYGTNHPVVVDFNMYHDAHFEGGTEINFNTTQEVGYFVGYMWPDKPFDFWVQFDHNDAVAGVAVRIEFTNGTDMDVPLTYNPETDYYEDSVKLEASTVPKSFNVQYIPLEYYSMEDAAESYNVFQNAGQTMVAGEKQDDGFFAEHEITSEDFEGKKMMSYMEMRSVEAFTPTDDYTRIETADGHKYVKLAPSYIETASGLYETIEMYVADAEVPGGYVYIQRGIGSPKSSQISLFANFEVDKEYKTVEECEDAVNEFRNTFRTEVTDDNRAEVMTKLHLFMQECEKDPDLKWDSIALRAKYNTCKLLKYSDDALDALDNYDQVFGTIEDIVAHDWANMFTGKLADAYMDGIKEQTDSSINQTLQDFMNLILNDDALWEKFKKYYVEDKMADTDMIMDPSGYVYETVPENRLADVTATLYFENDLGQMERWDAEQYFQTNPQITDTEGKYAWDVPEGTWQVRYEKDGYLPAVSEKLPVPPPQLEVNVAMVSEEPAQITSVDHSADGVTVTFDKYLDAETITQSAFVLTDGTGTIPFTLALPDAVLLADGMRVARTVVLLPDAELPPGTYTLLSSNSLQTYAGTGLPAQEEAFAVTEAAATDDCRILSVSMGSGSVSVEIHAGKGIGKQAVAASYAENGCLIDVAFLPLAIEAGETDTVTIPLRTTGAHHVTAFVLDSDFRPLCAEKTQ